jgi:hypothetical protein
LPLAHEFPARCQHQQARRSSSTSFRTLVLASRLVFTNPREHSTIHNLNRIGNEIALNTQIR